MYETQEKYDLVVLGDLSKREIRRTKNFHEWLERWQSAETLGELLGLLHEGFEVSLEASAYGEPNYKIADRLAFYLFVANGWTSAYTIESDSPSGVRQIVAQKAFNMLAQNFFKNGEAQKISEYWREDRSGSFWKDIVRLEQVFNAILYFFKIEKKRFGDGLEIPNLPHRRERSHAEQIAFNFLMNFVDLIWEWRDPEIESWCNEEERTKMKKYVDEIRERVDGAKPWTIEVMEIFDRLDLLRARFPLLDGIALVKLREIAMRQNISEFRHPVTNSRPVISLDEARFVGSRAAWLISEYELIKRERARLEQIRSAQREIEEANEKLKRLEEQKK